MIQLGISSDSSELVSSLTEDRTALKETESAFQKFGDVCVSAMQRAGDAAVSVLQEIGGALHTVSHSALESFGAAMGTAAAKSILFAYAAKKKTEYLNSLWTELRLGISAASWLVPWLKGVAIGLTVATAAVYAFGAANRALSSDFGRSIVSFEQTSKAWASYKDSNVQVIGTLKEVGNELLAVGAAATRTAAEATGVSAAFQKVDSVVGGIVQWFADSNREWAAGVRIIADATWDWADANGASSSKMRELAAASEALIAKQQQQADLFGQLRKMQDDAAQGAAHSAELQRIASLDSVDAINAEIQALQQKAAAAILAGDATEESQKRTAALFAALEGQKNTVANNATKSAELEKKNQELEAQKAINKAKEDAKRLEESAADQIARMQDELDLLTGAATKAEIAMRQAMRAGFSQEQADEIARVTAELERAREADRQANKKPERERIDRTSLKAELAGSQGANAIITRGIGGPNNDIDQKQLNMLQQILIATKANKSQQLIPLTLGVA